METIQVYVQGAFAGVPQTQESLEQQAELVADLTARVADLVERGHSEGEAFGIALSQIGDLQELVQEFNTAEPSIAVTPPVVSVQASRLNVHVAVITTGIAAPILALFLTIGLSANALDLVHVLLGLAAAVTGLLWIGIELLSLHRDPDAVSEVPLSGRSVVTRAAGIWAGLVVASFVANMFVYRNASWSWIVWVTAAAVPLGAVVRWRLISRGRFRADVCVDETACVEDIERHDRFA